MAFYTRAAASFILWEIFFPRIGLRRIAERSRQQRLRRLARQFCALAIQMGGVMIKVGQFLSSRLDVLPPEITEELASLQDEVPAEEFSSLQPLIENELNGNVKDKYAEFNPIPLAAASLGQVHQACLHHEDSARLGFQEVVVKIQRPFIEQLIEVDLSALQRFGRWLERYPPIRKRVDIRALIEEFSFTIRQEIDYLNEGQNAEKFAENFKAYHRVHVPRVVWTHTTRKILTLENVFAIKITDFDAIASAGIDRSEVANELLAAYLKQIFEDGFFHADPHPGNLFVTPTPAEHEHLTLSWRLTFVDFGMSGTVPVSLRAGLRELLIAVGTRDPARMVRAYQSLGILLPGADLELIQQAEAKVFERFWGMSMRELTQIRPAELLEFAREFRSLLYTMPFQLPHNLLLLGRTIAILSGMCTGLDPEFNVWNQLAPYAQKLIAEEGTTVWRSLTEEVGRWIRLMASLPARTERILTQIEKGDLIVQSPAIHQQIKSLEKAINRLTVSIIFLAMLLGVILLFNAGQHLFAALLLAALPIMLLIALRNRSS